MKDFLTLAQNLHLLAVFQKLYDNELFEAFLAMLDAFNENRLHFPVMAARFCGKLYEQDCEDWGEYLKEQVLGLDTCLSRLAAKEHELPERMVNTAMEELSALATAASVSSFDLGLPARQGWIGANVDLQAEYLNCLMEIDVRGTGIFAKGSMFRLKAGPNVELVPVVHPDPVTFKNLYGYEDQHRQMIANTRALLKGLPAGNLLLYGDAGTGKSASIKALENKFKDQGLRLIEVSKERLEVLPELLDELAREPLKFIVYIDDLSFAENDDSFSALKAVLEGSVSARSENTVIYATSNRRHLVKESMEARSGDDLHRRDTLQETLSLSQRFGQCLFFEKPSAAEFLELVHKIGREYGLQLDSVEMDRQAEAYALRQGGRSARCARQFAENEAAKKGIQNDLS